MILNNTTIEPYNWTTLIKFLKRVVLYLSVLSVILGFATNAFSNETYRQLNLFGDVFERVRAEYVDKVSDKKLIEAAINGMLTSLDPHSSFLDTKNFKNMRVDQRGIWWHRN
jgi:C-terminal processing protease CtpA/Prc